MCDRISSYTTQSGSEYPLLHEPPADAYFKLPLDTSFFLREVKFDKIPMEFADLPLATSNVIGYPDTDVAR